MGCSIASWGSVACGMADADARTDGLAEDDGDGAAECRLVGESDGDAEADGAVVIAAVADGELGEAAGAEDAEAGGGVGTGAGALPAPYM